MVQSLQVVKPRPVSGCGFRAFWGVDDGDEDVLDVRQAPQREVQVGVCRIVTKRQARHLKSAFLEAFREHGNVTWACRQIGMTNRTEVYRWQENDDQFAAAFRDAEIEATETMEQEAYRRAVKGTAKPVYQQGAMVGTVQEYSDVLLIFMLKARNPEKYRDKAPADPSMAAGGLDIVIDRGAGAA